MSAWTIEFATADRAARLLIEQDWYWAGDRPINAETVADFAIRLPARGYVFSESGGLLVVGDADDDELALYVHAGKLLRPVQQEATQ